MIYRPSRNQCGVQYDRVSMEGESGPQPFVCYTPQPRTAQDSASIFLSCYNSQSLLLTHRRKRWCLQEYNTGVTVEENIRWWSWK